MKTGTIVAIAAGMNNSGIGIIRTSGEETFSMIGSIFRNRRGKRVSLNLAQLHIVHYGYMYDEGEKVGEALVITMKGPHSYTVEDTMETDCYEGVLMVKRIPETVLHAEARTAESGEFTERAFLNGRLDSSQAEAVADVIHVTNEYALKSSVSQLSGSVSNKIKKLHSQILYQIAFIESALDNPEHISLDGYGSQLVDTLTSMIDEVREFLLSAGGGRFMSEGAKTVILGKPNAGESSLMNVLLGEERAIVTEVTGTIRGTLEEHICLQGISLNMVDTAGVRDTEGVVEKTGMDRVPEAARDTDLITYVVDGSRPLDESDKEIMDFIRGRKTIVLLDESDSDLEMGTGEPGQFCGHKVIPVSAKEEQGTELLEQEAKELFYHGDLPFNDQVYITNARHKKALKQCLRGLLTVKGNVEDDMPGDFYSIDLMNAYEQLGFIIGGSVDDDVVNKVFAKFCMDKQGNLIQGGNVE